MIAVAIYTDGMGTWQAQCTGCAWRSRWVRTEARAIEHGKTHTEHTTDQGATK